MNSQNQISNTATLRPHVVIIGGGFAGLNAARAFRGKDVRVTLLDRKNHHTFQPLLYQVALAALSPAEIASPIRTTVREQKNVEVVIGTADNFDLDRRGVRLQEGLEVNYDYLVVATGATHSYFGHPEWAKIAPGLKSLEDATEIRRRILLAFELSERESLLEGMQRPINFVVVGAGPTGVELSGAIAEISQHVLKTDFRGTDPRRARVILLEGGPRVLASYSEDLSAKAQKQLEELGVEVHTGTLVTNLEPGVVHVGDKKIDAAVILWAAGVQASHLGRALGSQTDRSGRVLVNDHLNIPGHPEVFVLGDLARLEQGGAPLPGVAQVAIQMGKYAAAEIVRRTRDQTGPAFHYHDKGSMATIGRARGIAQIGKTHLSGFPAWFAWLCIHLIFLIGYRNRFAVLLDWMWQYLSWQSGARLITGNANLPGWHEQHTVEEKVEEAQKAG
jgi:NADH:ubiquinone reductase (H+-translocating)